MEIRILSNFPIFRLIFKTFVNFLKNDDISKKSVLFSDFLIAYYLNCRILKSSVWFLKRPQWLWKDPYCDTHLLKKISETILYSKGSINSRSSHRRCSVRKGVLRNFTKLSGKHLCQGLFFNKVVGLRPATLLKKRLWHSCFPENFVKFLRTPFYRTPLGDCF